jgi:hypothetical protein
MVIPESTLGGGKFSACGSTTVGNNTSAYNDSCAPGKDCSTVVWNGSWDNAHTFDSSSRGKRLGGKPSTLVHRASGSSDDYAGHVIASATSWC